LLRNQSIKSSGTGGSEINWRSGSGILNYELGRKKSFFKNVLTKKFEGFKIVKNKNMFDEKIKTHEPTQ
jgi:hypothetical protein